MPKLVIMSSQANNHRWLSKTWFQNYPVEYYDPEKRYSANTVFLHDMYGGFQDLIPDQLAQGHKIVYNALNEHYLQDNKQLLFNVFCAYPGQVLILISGTKAQSIPGLKISASPYWYWVMDQVEFIEFGYHRYTPEPNLTHKFFMQLNLKRFCRDQLYSQLEPVLAQGLHSYRERGIFLPGDKAMGLDTWHQRYMNWDWINACSITLAAETFLEDGAYRGGFSLTEQDNKFLSEKTYKPLAYGHAFLLASTQGNLAHVREQGFETFGELWDESYDDLQYYYDRFDAIVEIIQKFDPRSLDNSVTRDKIAYNRNRFFDKEITARLLREIVVEPILAFLHE